MLRFGPNEALAGRCTCRFARNSVADELPDAVGGAPKRVSRNTLSRCILDDDAAGAFQRHQGHSRAFKARLNGATAQLTVNIVGEPITAIDAKKLGVKVLTEDTSRSDRPRCPRWRDRGARHRHGLTRRR